MEEIVKFVMTFGSLVIHLYVIGKSIFQNLHRKLFSTDLVPVFIIIKVVLRLVLMQPLGHCKTFYFIKIPIMIKFIKSVCKKNDNKYPMASKNLLHLLLHYDVLQLLWL